MGKPTQRKMSHRKFEAPRHGNLGFLPRKRTRKHFGKIRSFHKDDRTKPAHFTAFAGWKAGMTHVARECVRNPHSRLHRKEIIEAVTIIETPPVKVVGIVGYIETPKGLRALTTVWTNSLGDDFRRRLYKNWYKSKKKAFTKHSPNNSAESNEAKLNRLVRYCSVIRVIVHTQPKLLNNIDSKKGHIMEVQVNGGDSIQAKVDFAKSWLEKDLKVNDVLTEGQVIDVIGVTKGKGVAGVAKRWNTTLLPRKTHRGLRRVGCIGAWHPSRVQWTIARTGQLGYHHRTEPGKKIYKIGKAAAEGCTNNASTEADLTEKNITPMGGFPHYGEVKQDYIMIEGCCVGVKKRPLVLRHQIHDRKFRTATETVNLKFIDTSSKMGHGRFQTKEEKAKFYGREAPAQ